MDLKESVEREGQRVINEAIRTSLVWTRDDFLSGRHHGKDVQGLLSAGIAFE